MPVEVRLPTLLRPHADGAATVSATGATVGEVFADLAARYPGLSDQLVDESGSIHKFVNVYRNDDDIRYLELSVRPSAVARGRRTPRESGRSLWTRARAGPWGIGQGAAQRTRSPGGRKLARRRRDPP